MKALVHYGPGKRSREDVPDPAVSHPEDAVVEVDAFTLCGTDLHILRGDVPEVQAGRILGHEGLGADVAIEAVGVPEAFDLAVAVTRPGGHVADVGVHGRPTTLHLEELWSRDLTLTTGLVDTSSTPMLLRLMAAGLLDAGRMVTQRFGFDEVPRAYEVFDDPMASQALKVVVARA